MATDAIRAWIQATLRRTPARRGRARLRLDGLEARVNPAPYLVADINAVASRVGSSPIEFAAVNGTLFFSAADPVRGTELWKSDGTAAGTALVKDVWAGFDSSSPAGLTAVGNSLFFTAADGADGLGLWKSDGTPAGTGLVRQFPTGNGMLDPRTLTAVGDTLFFLTSPDAGGSELWKSDGTAAGTVRVKGGLASLVEDSYANMTALNGTLYFSADDGVAGLELWKSDGTTAGTVPVKDVAAGADGSGPHHLIAANGALFFTAEDSPGDRELWKSDGTAPGTVRVKDIWPGADGSVPYDLVVADGTLYFAADNGTAGRELWKSDGTAAGTVQVRNIVAGADGSYPAFLTAVGSVVYFAALTGAGTELWTSDGTSAGTVQVKNIRPGADGSYPTALTTVGGTLYFIADDGTTGVELWKSDGTAAGTVVVKDIAAGAASSYPQTPIAVGGTLFFAADDGAAGPELWKSDGTAAGTVLVKDIWAGTGNAAPESLTTLNGTLFVGADDGASGHELWKSDGTAAGTARVKDINPGAAGSFPGGLTVVNGLVYFTADDGTSGTELWKSDGTAAGTVLVKDIAAGSGGAYPRELTVLNGTLYFTASVSGSGRELWKTDGTAAGTVLVKDIRLGSSSSTPVFLTAITNALYFAANDGTTGTELWKSDGTEAGTVRVKDIFAGGLPSQPEALTAVNGTLFFTANDGTTHRELWKSDGTAAGTVLVKDIAATAASSPGYLTSLNGALYFTADDGVVGRELWKSDGTAAGTVLVKDIAAGAGTSSPLALAAANGALFLRADDGVAGGELWKSDGTAAGTVLVKDIAAGARSSAPWFMTGAGGTVYFRAHDGVTGEELWKTDGTAAGTVLVADVVPGSGASYPMSLTAAGPRLYFTAVTEASGQELWAVDPPPVVTFTAASQSAAEAAGTMTITAQLSTAFNETVTIPFTLSGTATGVEDYTITASPITIPAGQLTGTAVITVVNDAADEPDETVVVTMGVPANAVAGPTTVHTATIADDDAAPSVSFATAAGSAAEGVTTRTITVSLSAASGLTVTVPYTVTGTATNPADYTVAPASPLTFAPGTVSQTITLTVVNDTTDEPDETVVLTLGTPTNAALGGTTTYTETIADDDAAPTVSFAASGATAAEGVATRTVTVSLSAASSFPITVPYSVGGSAVDPADYTIAPASPLAFAPGETSKTITLTVVNDAMDEADETVVLTLGTPTNAALGTTTVHTATITDDDPAPTVSFAASGASAAEGVATRTVTVSLSAASGLTVTIPYTVGGSAASPADYTVAPASPLTFAPGVVSQAITLTVVSDVLDEADKTVVLALGTPTNAGLGTPATYTETITDDDPAPTVAFAASGASAAEAVITRTITVSLSAASGQAVTVPYSVGGSATSPADYTIAPASPLTFAPGVTTQTITLTVVNDTTDEPDETVVLTLGTPTNAALGATTVHTATITDDDAAPTVSFAAAAGSAAEGVATRTVTVSLLAASGLTVTVPYTVGGTSVDPADYTIAPASPLTFAPGETSRALTLTVVDDALDEADETVVLTLGTPTNAGLGTTTVHTATITDDDPAPTVSFTTSAGSAAEGVATRTVTVSLSAASGQTVTVPYTVGGSATDPADYTIAPASPLTFAPGTVSQTITLTVVNDALDEADETVILTLGTPTNAALGATTTYTETVTDDDAAPTVSFATAAGSAAEGVATRTVTVSLSAASGQTVTVPYTVGGSATSPADYTLAPATPLAFAPGETSRTITITVVDDALDEADETVVLTLGTPTNAALGGTTAYTETVTDNDPAPTVSFTTSAASAAEGVTTRTITVSLSAASGLTVAVPYSLSGTATNPADYTIAPASPLTFGPGETSRSITLTVVNDTTDEPDETVVLTLGTPTNAALGTTTVHTATIADDDPAPSVSFVAASGSAAEGVATRTVTVSLSAASAFPISVPYSVGGTAVAPADYTIAPASPLAFAPGEVTQTITLTVVNDTDQEADKTVVLTLGTPTNATVGTTATHTQTIVNDDAVPTVSFAAAAGSAAEGVTTRTVTMTLSAASAFPITVPYTVGGSATDPADYAIAPASPIAFAPGVTSRTITLTVVNDALDEPDETVVLTLGTPTNAGLGPTTTYTETITDDDVAPTVAFTTSAGSAAEGVTTRTVTVSLSAASGQTVTVPYTVGGSAASPADYTIAPASPLTFAPGETTRTITLTVVDDATDEPDETVVLTLGTPTNAALGATTVHTATITDDDAAPTVSFAAAGATAAEGVTTRSVTVSLSAASSFPITVPYSVGGTATNPADYTIAPASPLAFAPGETSRTVTLTVVDDTTDEADETVVLTLGGPTNATLGTPATYTATIADDDAAPTVSFTMAAGSAAEGVATRTVTVSLSVPSALPVTVPYSVGGTASNPADYTLAPASPLTFAPGETSQTITVTVAADTIDETDETIALTLGGPTNAILGGTSEYIETITDDDPAPTVTFTTAAGLAAEGVATRTVTVSLSAASGLTVTVPYTVGGSATSPADYAIAPPGPLSFAPGETTRTITLTVVDDTTDEPDETVVLTLGTPTNAALGGTTTYTETITDNDPAPAVSFTSPAASAAEGVATRTITVSLSAASGQTVTVPYAVSGTALDPADYTVAPPSPVVFAPGEMSRTITLTVVNDTIDEPDETVVLALGAPTNATLGTTTTYTETVADDDPAPTVSFTSPAASAAEGVTTRTITVSLSGLSAFPITVPYSIGGSAVAPADYAVAPAGPVTFAPGETSQTITLTVVNDAVQEPDETVVLTLGTPTNATLGTTTAHTETIVNDDGVPTVSFTTAAGSAAEGVATRTVTVSLSGPSAFPVTVPYTVGGSATNPADYTIAPAGPLTFAPGETTQTITLTVVDDALDELNETVLLTLGTPTNGVLGATATYSETIADDDPPPTVTFAAAGGSADETVATRTVTVLLSAPSALPVTVPYAVGGNAAAPADYTIAPAGPLTFAPGETSQTITLTVVNDTAIEPDETIVLTLGAPTNATVGTPDTYTETIEEAFGITVTPPTATYTTEGGSTVTFTVVLTAVPTGDVVIPIASTDASEATVSAPQLVFTAANAGVPQTVTVTGVGDTAVDLNQAYSILLGAAESDDPRFAGLDPADLGLVNVEFLPRGRRTFVDADGDQYTVKLTGPGQVGVLPTGADVNGPGAIDRIILSPASDPTKSRLAVTVKKVAGGNGLVDIGVVTGPGLKSFAAAASDLVGEGAVFTGYLGSLKVRDIKNGADVVAGGTPDQLTAITAVDVGAGTAIDLGSGLRVLRVARFGDGRVEAPRAGALSATGNAKRAIPADFAADVRLTGDGVKSGAKTLGSLTVGGTIRGSAIEANGNVGSVKAKAFVDSSLLVGLDGTMRVGVKLGSFTVGGYKGSTDPAFADADVTADRIGTVTLKSVGTIRPDEPFGVTAGVSLAGLRVATPAFLYSPKGPVPQGLNLDQDADLEFVVRVG